MHSLQGICPKKYSKNKAKEEENIEKIKIELNMILELSMTD
tara:strand:+ start:1090 stop:1212 length:123 start_codon:yes stop_codon:yes gene_type:complete